MSNDFLNKQLPTYLDINNWQVFPHCISIVLTSQAEYNELIRTLEHFSFIIATPSLKLPNDRFLVSVSRLGINSDEERKLAQVINFILSYY